MTENEAISRMRYRVDTATHIIGKGVDGKAYEDMEMAIKALEEIHQYRAIGTVEEFREGRERQIPKKPMRIRLLETSGVHCGICPICKNPVYADLSNKNHREYCGHCGQAIDWSENNGE